MAAILQESSSQPADITRAVSYHGFLHDFDGDTQPLPSHIYREHKSGAQSFPESGQDAFGHGSGPGLVNLFDDWKSPSQFTVVDHIPKGTDIHSIDDSAPEDGSQGIFSSLRKDCNPKTPGLSNRKDLRRDVLSPETSLKTPAHINAFLNMGAPPLLTATQMFDNTQAMSSPAQDLTKSDPIDSRPSPNFHHIETLSPSDRTQSSPIKPPVVETPRVLVGPRDTYKPMDESQKRREQAWRKQQLQSEKVQFDGDDSLTSDFIRDRFHQYKNYHNRGVAKASRGSAERTKDQRPSASRRVDKDNLVSQDTAVIELDGADLVEQSDDESIKDYDDMAQPKMPPQKVNNNDSEQPVDIDFVSSSKVANTQPGLVQRTNGLGNGFKHGMVDSNHEVEVPNSASERYRTNNTQVTDHDSLQPMPIDLSPVAPFVPASQFPPSPSPTRVVITSSPGVNGHSNTNRPPFSSVIASNIASSSPFPSGDVESRATIKDSEAIFNKRREIDNDCVPASSITPIPIVSSGDSDVLVLKSVTTEKSNENQGKNATNSNGVIYETAPLHLLGSKTMSFHGRITNESPRKVGSPPPALADIAKQLQHSQKSTSSDVDLAQLTEGLENNDPDFFKVIKKQAQVPSSSSKGPRKRKVDGEDRSVCFDFVTDDPHDVDAAETAKGLETGDRREITTPERDSQRKRRKIERPNGHVLARKMIDKDVIDETVMNVDDKDYLNVPAYRQQRTSATNSRTLDEGDLARKGKLKKRISRARSPSPSLVKQSDEPQVRVSARSHVRNAEGHVSKNSKADEVNAPVDEVHDTDAVNPVNVDNSAPACSDRVLALFNGTVYGFYPATCTNISGSGPLTKYEVKFDDGTQNVIDLAHICAFDLRVDDIVKVDMPQMRSNLYQVVGFEESAIQADGEKAIATDMHGHTAVKLRIKPKINGKGAAIPSKSKKVEIVTVPIRYIYVTSTMWSKFRIRVYQHEPGHKTEAPRSGTPSIINPSTPSTPTSRSRRQTLNSGHIPSHLSTIPFPTQKGNLFHNMAFAISLTPSSTIPQRERDALVLRITEQGGRILKEGLHELFHPPSFSSSTSPASSPQDALPLTVENNKLGFVALIADSHSRTQKYIQALALSLPIIHYRWIEDCIRRNHLLEWENYLLPSGESSFLHGAVKSRVLVTSTYNAENTEAGLCGVLSRRKKLLNGGGSGVLLYANTKEANTTTGKGKGKNGKEDDKRSLYAFLSLAIGAEKVDMVDGLQKLKTRLVKEQGWKWIYASAELVDSIVDALGGKTVGLESREKVGKRKKSLNTTGGDEEEYNGRIDVDKLSTELQSGIRVVSDEYVIQSLILGALI